VVLLLSAAAALWAYRRYSPGGRWRAQAYSELGVLVVDYTVPFETYREHRGLFWLLDHRKIRPPGARAQEGDAWQPARDYVGYRPTDREHPVRLAHVDRSRAQLIYVADTYGVYRDDLANLETGTAHMDYTPLVFGGLSGGDAHALAEFAARGGSVIAEFNTFCEPTGAAARASMEALFGLDWTEWVGRVFADPHDTDDVPHWLPREFAKQFPGRELPHSPMLLLVARSGQLLVLEGPSIGDVAPRVIVNSAGHARFPGVQDEAPYYFWFSVMRERPGTRVFARLKLDILDEATQQLMAAQIPLDPPLLSERAAGRGRAVYLAGDFADIDFEPGSYDSEGAIANNAGKISALSGMTTAPSFWRFYAPVMEKLLEEAQHNSLQR
jgi:hypothetical protein